MPMLKSLPAVDMTVQAAQTGVLLGETPFFPGANATLQFNIPVGGSGVLTLQGSPDNTTWTTIRTVNAAQSAPLAIELTNLPKYFRTNVTTVGTGNLALTLRGTQ